MIWQVLILTGVGCVGILAGWMTAREERKPWPEFDQCGEPALGGPCQLRKGHEPVPDDHYQSGGHRYYQAG